MWNKIGSKKATQSENENENNYRKNSSHNDYF